MTLKYVCVLIVANDILTPVACLTVGKDLVPFLLTEILMDWSLKTYSISERRYFEEHILPLRDVVNVLIQVKLLS